VIFFVPGTDCKKIAYNTLGARINVLTADGSDYETKAMTAEELEEVKKKAEELFGDLEDSTVVEFEQALTNYSDDTAEVNEFDDGYYLNVGQDYTNSGEKYAYLDETVKALQEMEVGEVRMIKSAFGYHIIRKYAHSDKAYDNEVNKQWFSDFHQSLIEELFAEKCLAYYEDIVCIEKVYAAAPTMKEVGVNYYY
jgi:parvulin-like peptidyl-prolyl isomerase